MRKWDMSSKRGKGVILSIILKNPGVTIRQIEHKIGDSKKSRSMVYKNVSELIQAGYVKRDFEPRGDFTSTSTVSKFFITEEGINKLEECRQG